MRKITLFLLMAVCVVVLMTTQPCEGKKKQDVAESEEKEESDGNKPMRRRLNRDRRPGLDNSEPPGQADEQEKGSPRHGRRHRHHGKDKDKNKPQDGDSESASESKE